MNGCIEFSVLTGHGAVGTALVGEAELRLHKLGLHGKLAPFFCAGLLPMFVACWTWPNLAEHHAYQPCHGVRRSLREYKAGKQGTTVAAGPIPLTAPHCRLVPCHPRDGL